MSSDLYRINEDSFIVQTMGRPVVDEVMRWVEMGVLVKVETVPVRPTGGYIYRSGTFEQPWASCEPDEAMAWLVINDE